MGVVGAVADEEFVPTARRRRRLERMKSSLCFLNKCNSASDGIGLASGAGGDGGALVSSCWPLEADEE